MISLSAAPKLVEKKDGNVGVFQIEALYPGYGVTVGNSLRRVLLSSLPGAAVTRVKIQGAEHEFSTLPGLYEDVISVLLNIKQLRFRLHGDDPQSAALRVKGEQEVTGANLTLPSQLELANPETHLATLTDKKGELAADLQVERGVGYVQAEAHTRQKEEIGSIALDAAFSPVRKVSMRVENMRVGERTDFDRLILEIETDGTITPETAFHQAADILRQEFQVLAEGVEEVEPEQAKKPSVKKTAAKTAAGKTTAAKTTAKKTANTKKKE